MVWMDHSWVATRPLEHGWGAPSLGLPSRKLPREHAHGFCECAGVNVLQWGCGVLGQAH